MIEICNGCGDTIQDDEEYTGFGFGEEEFIFCMDCSLKEANIETVVKKIMLSMGSENETMH